LTTTTLVLKRGDRLPSALVPLTNNDGSAVNLTGATVTFSMRSGPAATPKVNAGTVNIVGDPALGMVRYDWAAGDTDTVGTYLATFLVTAGGETQSYPGAGFLLVVIQPAVTDVPVFGAQALPGYCSVAALQAYPSYQNLANLVPGKDAAAQAAELGNMIARASGLMDGFMSRSLLPKAGVITQSARVNNDLECLLVPGDRPFNRVTAFTSGPLGQPVSEAGAGDPTGVYVDYVDGDSVPILHLPIGNMGGGVRARLVVNLETGYANTPIGAVAAAASALAVTKPIGLAPGVVLRLADPGKEEVVTVGPSYAVGSTAVPLVAPLVFAHAAGVIATAIPTDLEEACILWTLSLLARGGTPAEDTFADAPVPANASTKNARRGGTGYLAQAKKIIVDGGYTRVMA